MDCLEIQYLSNDKDKFSKKYARNKSTILMFQKYRGAAARGGGGDMNPFQILTPPLPPSNPILDIKKKLYRPYQEPIVICYRLSSARANIAY